MTEISAIIRARLDEGRAIADEDVRALLNERDTLRAALKELNAAFDDWFDYTQVKDHDPNKETEACLRLLKAKRAAVFLTEGDNQ